MIEIRFLLVLFFVTHVQSLTDSDHRIKISRLNHGREEASSGNRTQSPMKRSSEIIIDPSLYQHGGNSGDRALTAIANHPSPRMNEKAAQSRREASKVSKTKTTSQVMSSSSPPGTTNVKSDSLRRIRSEWKLAANAGIAYHWRLGRPILNQKSRILSPSHLWLGPLDERNLYVWHFTMVGIPGSPFEGGLYHGRIILPRSYPRLPPRVQVWTESGRFFPRVDICLSASSYHPESWTPTHYSIQTIVEGLRLHMTTSALEIGGMNAAYDQKVALAASSLEWRIRIPLASSSGPVVIDHERMIRQGLFNGLLRNETAITTTLMNPEETTEEEAPPSQTFSSMSSISQRNINTHAAIGRTKKAKARRRRINSFHPHSKKFSLSLSSLHTIQPIESSTTRCSGVSSLAYVVRNATFRLSVAAIRCIPFLICILCWRATCGWLLRR